MLGLDPKGRSRSRRHGRVDDSHDGGDRNGGEDSGEYDTANGRNRERLYDINDNVEKGRNREDQRDCRASANE